MLALLEDVDGVNRCPMAHSKSFSEDSESNTVDYNSPASSCIEDYNVAAEVEISRDLNDPEFSFYDECLLNIETEMKPSDTLPWANLANLGETCAITEFSINECRSRQTEGEFSENESVCSDDYYWNRCNEWIKRTSSEAKDNDDDDKSYTTTKMGSKSKRKYNKKSRRNIDEMSWNEMTVDEQRGTIEDLTNIVSSTMGLREQLDVIRILNPDAVVSAADTEFEIDLDLLNCHKLEKIRKYVRRHRIQTVKMSKSNSPSNLKKTKRKNTDPLQRKVEQKQAKEQNALLTRVYKQLLKEKRSGLFHNEQVVSISKKQLEEDDCNGDKEDDDEDEIEIDILY